MDVQKDTPKRATTVAAMIGTALEYYDTSLYGFMAVILVKIFLPTIDPINALILTFILPVVAIFIRPLGAIFIGRIGDKFGRKKALTISICGMAIATGLIGLLPTYSTIGVLAPILFLIFRSTQQFFVSGEYNGGAIFILEHAPKHKQGYFSGLYCMYTVVGILSAAIVASLISRLPEIYWRIPFIIGFLTGIVGLYIRKHVHESPKFIEYHKTEEIQTKDIVKKYGQIFSCISISGMFSALYSLSTLLMIAILPQVTSFDLPQIMLINTATTVLYMLSLPFFGMLADRVSIYKTLVTSTIVLIILAYPLISLIQFDNLYCILAMKFGFALITGCFVAPIHAWMQSLFHTRERYRAISFSYSIGSQLGSMMVPLSLWYWKNYNSFLMIYSALIFWAIVSIIAITYQKKSIKHD